MLERALIRDRKSITIIPILRLKKRDKKKRKKKKKKKKKKERNIDNTESVAVHSKHHGILY